MTEVFYLLVVVVVTVCITLLFKPGIDETLRQWVERDPEPIKPEWHMLKTWLEPFGEIVRGVKRFEIRKEDNRGFKVGDIIVLNEWDQHRRASTGRSRVVRVTYLIRGPEWGVPEGMVVMSIAMMR